MSNVLIDPNKLMDPLDQASKLSNDTSIMATELSNLIYWFQEYYQGMHDAYVGGGSYHVQCDTKFVERLKSQSEKMKEIASLINEAIIMSDTTTNNLNNSTNDLTSSIGGITSGTAETNQNSIFQNITKESVIQGIWTAFGALPVVQIGYTMFNWLKDELSEVAEHLDETHQQLSNYKKPEEIKAEMSERYKRILENTKRTSFNGACSAFTYQQLKDQGIFGKSDPGVASGKDYYATWSKKTTTSTGAKVTSYGSDANSTGLEKLIEASNGKPVSNVVVSFDAGYPYSSTHGHVLLISQIQNGKVYFMESANGKLFNLDGTSYKEGEMLELSVEDFLKQYPKMNGAVHFEK